jgi:hypothetical protein
MTRYAKRKLKYSLKENLICSHTLNIWKEHVEIDQITNFHEKIIWQSQLYRIPLTAWLKQHRKKTNRKIIASDFLQ